MEASNSPQSQISSSLYEQLGISSQGSLQNLARIRNQATNFIGMVQQINQRQAQQHVQRRSSINSGFRMIGENDPYQQDRVLERLEDSQISGQNQLDQLLKSQSNENPSNLDEIFSCFICFGKLQSAVMCPYCSKLCCGVCMKKWLTEQRQSCPHCRTNLRVNQLVNCRFVEEVTAAIDTLQSNKQTISKAKKELCAEHDTALNYYCNTCKKPICSDCAMFGQDHKAHEFEKLSVVYERHVEQIKKEATCLRKRLQDLNLFISEVQTTIEKVTKAKEEKCKEIELFVENIQNKLNQQLKSKLLTLLQQKGAMADEMEQLEEFHQKLNKELNAQAQSQLINKSNDLIKSLRDIHNKPTSKFVANSVSTEFPSELVPNYEFSTFTIRDFIRLRHTHEVVYSEPLLFNGLTWRLKVYPNGNGIAKGNYISIFLEMLKGLSEPSKYEYRVEMLNHKDPSVQIVREFSSDFEVGECWGYNRFYRIDLLDTEGFLSNDDSIQLKYFVRAPTYAQQSRDQKKYIEQLELQVKSLQGSVNEMNQKYNEAINKNKKQRSTQKKAQKQQQVCNNQMNNHITNEEEKIQSDNVLQQEESKNQDIDQQQKQVEEVKYSSPQNALLSQVIDAEQDFDSDDDDDEDEEIEDNQEEEKRVNLREWSPKQYSVSSDEENGDQDEEEVVDNNHQQRFYQHEEDSLGDDEEQECHQDVEDEDDEDDGYNSHNHNHQKNHDDLSVLREILNEERMRTNKCEIGLDHYNMSDDSYDEDCLNIMKRSENANHNEENYDSYNHHHHDHLDNDEEEEKENTGYGSTSNNNMKQMKKDFYERSKQLKHALTGIQQQSRGNNNESAIVSTKEILKSLQQNNSQRDLTHSMLQ